MHVGVIVRNSRTRSVERAISAAVGAKVNGFGTDVADVAIGTCGDIFQVNTHASGIALYVLVFDRQSYQLVDTLSLAGPTGVALRVHRFR
jgi:hypothetical protein